MKIPVDIKTDSETGETSFIYEDHSYEQIVQAMHLYKAFLTVKDIFNIDSKQEVKESHIAQSSKEVYPDVLSTDEACAAIPYTRSPLFKMKKNGQIHTNIYYYAGRRLFFIPDELEKWICNVRQHNLIKIKIGGDSKCDICVL